MLSQLFELEEGVVGYNLRNNQYKYLGYHMRNHKR